MTWDELAAEVRAQVDVDLTQAYAWLLDCARVMNAEAGWLLKENVTPAVTGQLEYELPPDLVRVEAILVGSRPYQRSTLSQLDHARSGYSTGAIYADAVDPSDPDQRIAVHPPPSTGNTITMRYIGDVPEPDPDDTAEVPPFPLDVQQAIADGAIGIGLARMDERFDSAGYFAARFTDGIARLKRRRHGQVGRGATRIRLVS